MKSIGTFVAALVLTGSLAACGGGAETGGVASPKPSSHAGQPSDQVATLKTPVCQAISAGDVSRAIGMKVYTANDINGTNGAAEPTICNYYTDPDELDNVYVQWMTVQDALWSDALSKVETPPPGATMERVDGGAFGADEALKETLTYEETTTVTYLLLLKRKGVVLHVQEVNGLSDSKLRALARLAVQKL